VKSLEQGLNPREHEDVGVDNRSGEEEEEEEPEEDYVEEYCLLVK
jgi:hypothetical protein